MDVLKALLNAREHKSPQVQALLDCLNDPAFNLQVCICSVGGVGSTELGNFLTRAGTRCNLLTDQDAIRHVNRPPPQLGPETKVVYLFGDPLASVASHYRRNHAFHQALKTSGNAANLDESTFPNSFQEYIDRGEDLFGLESHFHNWLHTPRKYDVLFVRYESMFDLPVARAMFNYLCSPAAAGSSSCNEASSSSSSSTRAAKDIEQLAAAFAASKKQRASQINPKQRRTMYVELAAEMAGLPSIFVRSADCKQVAPLVGAADPDGNALESCNSCGPVLYLLSLQSQTFLTCHWGVTVLRSADAVSSESLHDNNLH